MNREILFMGKRLDNGQWIEGNLLLSDDGKVARIIIWNNIGYDEYPVDPATVGQYTGCTDVDGDKIYEGDILTATIFDHNGHDTMHIVIVEWDEKYAQYLCLDVNDKDCMWDLGWIILNDGEPLIVGNRWDNPSLTKGESND